MNTTIGQRIQLVPITLMLIMVLTRFGHFGSAFSLPDASLAVFFLAGLSFNKPKFFVLLLVAAGLIDYLAINQFSVSDFCISPAYVCLILTYGVMWLAGGYCKRYQLSNFAVTLKAFGLAATATALAFTISNSSFYLLSGRFGALSWAQYFSQSGQYFPAYLSSALIYIVIGLALRKLWRASQHLASIESKN